MGSATQARMESEAVRASAPSGRINSWRTAGPVLQLTHLPQRTHVGDEGMPSAVLSPVPEFAGALPSRVRLAAKQACTCMHPTIACCCAHLNDRWDAAQICRLGFGCACRCSSNGWQSLLSLLMRAGVGTSLPPVSPSAFLVSVASSPFEKKQSRRRAVKWVVAAVETETVAPQERPRQARTASASAAWGAPRPSTMISET